MCDVRDGIKEDKVFLFFIYEFFKYLIEVGEYLKFENFYIINLNLGVFVDFEYLILEFNKVKDVGEELFRDFLVKYLNIEIGMNFWVNCWVGVEYWV